VNGRAWVSNDPALLERMPAQGVLPRLAIGVEVEQTYLHCVKSFRRSRLWAKETWPAADALPRYACTLFDQIKPQGVTLEEFEQGVKESDAKLYV